MLVCASRTLYTTRPSFIVSKCRKNVLIPKNSYIRNGISFTKRGLATEAKIPIENIRNVAIIAHVDHGKTTLVDQLLRQSGTLKQIAPDQQDRASTPSKSSSSVIPTTAANVMDNGFVTRVMDSNDLEKERGITILSKCTSIVYDGHLINIVDTPGHADFGGEVERVLSMVDGVVLVVDATEGPMTQTRFVLKKALGRGLKPVVVLNKSDRPTARPAKVENDLFDLFATLGASDHQIDYPVLFASAKQGWAQWEPPKIQQAETIVDSTSMKPLLSAFIDHVPPPTHLSRQNPFQMLIVQISPDPYLGPLYLGRIHAGRATVGSNLLALDSEGNKVGEGKVKKLFIMRGVERIECGPEGAAAGEIVSIAGITVKEGGGVNLTLVDKEGWENTPEPLPINPIDPPTISTYICPNDSPLAGQEGSKVTSQLIRERLYREASTNVALKVLPGPTSESIELRGRGVLHLGILFEEMRREGFEFGIAPPKAVLHPDPERPGKFLEPIEECTIMVKDQYAGKVVEKLTMRKGEIRSYEATGALDGSGGEKDEGWVRIEMDVPARGLIGYVGGEFKNDVHGEGQLNHIFKDYQPYKGPIDTGRSGSLISMSAGESSAYAMAPLQARGIMFIHPQTQVYPGMVIGATPTGGSLNVNPCLKKQLTNIRAAGADEKIVISAPKIMTLEEMIAYMEDDELVEVTPKNIRLRKAILDPKKRKK